MDVRAQLKLRFWIAVVAMLVALERLMRKRRRQQYGPILVVVLESGDPAKAFGPN